MKGKELTGYPSVDKPWLNYYDEGAVNAPLPECTIYEYLWAQNKDYLTDVALVFCNKEITYGELFKKIDAIAKSFLALGIRSGDIVSVCIPNIPEAIYIFYALNRISCICNFLDPRSSEAVMHEHLDLVNSKLIVTIAECYDIFKNLKKCDVTNRILVLNITETVGPLKRSEQFAYEDIIWQEFLALSDSVSIPNCVRNIYRTSVILHTGGTTGTPKGVCLCDNNFHSLVVQWSYLNLNYKRAETLLSLMPPFVSFGLAANMHVPLSLGMRLVLIPEYNPEKVVGLVEQYKPNCIPASPAHWEVMYNSSKFRSMDLSFLKFAFIGGDTLNIKIEQGLNSIFQATDCAIKIVKGYGMTETTTAIAMTFNEDINFLGSVGVPLPKTIVGIFDQLNNELSYNHIGEICVQSPSNMNGYYKNKSETEKSIQTHSDGKKWIHTGDMGLMTPDGILYIKGRIKRIIIRYDGIKIYPVDIESKLLDCPGITDCAVVPAKDPDHLQGSVPAAVLVLDPNMQPKDTVKQIESYCLKHIIDYAIPHSFRFMDQLPHTSNGKIDYRFLEKMVAEDN